MGSTGHPDLLDAVYAISQKVREAQSHCQCLNQVLEWEACWQSNWSLFNNQRLEDGYPTATFAAGL